MRSLVMNAPVMARLVWTEEVERTFAMSVWVVRARQEEHRDDLKEIWMGAEASEGERVVDNLREAVGTYRCSPWESCWLEKSVRRGKKINAESSIRDDQARCRGREISRGGLVVQCPKSLGLR